VSGRKSGFNGWNDDRICVEQSRSEMDINGRYLHALTRVRVGPARIADSQADPSALALLFVFQLNHFSIPKDVNAHFPPDLVGASSSYPCGLMP
jgi:hypothetical protein